MKYCYVHLAETEIKEKPTASRVEKLSLAGWRGKGGGNGKGKGVEL